MPTPVFLTVDTEFAWRHHAAGHDSADIYARSIEPADVGLSFQLDRLRRHALKACFFVDPMPALVFGLEPFRRMVEMILDAEQEVQLHLHPNWTTARADDRGAAHARFELVEYDFDAQRDLISGAADLLAAAGAPRPIAFRAGSYAADDDTLAALAQLGFVYDSSHNGAAVPWPSRIGLPANRIAPVWRGVIEVPVTVIEDAPGSLRTFQVCALSAAESRDALEHAAANGHAAVTIVSHGFELANRAGTAANGVHVRRFERLCEMLDEHRDVLPTTHFADRPALALDRDDAPLGPNMLRTRWRQPNSSGPTWSRNAPDDRAAMTAATAGIVVAPIRFQIGARTLASIPRRLVRVAWSLADVLDAQTGVLPPPGDGDGYLITSIPLGLVDGIAASGFVSHVANATTAIMPI